MLADRRNRVSEIDGLAGSAAAMLFTQLPKGKEPYLIIANDLDEAGYAYVIGRRDPSLDLRRFTGTIRETLNARGGGSAEMLQGRAAASRSAIQSFFDSHTFSNS